MIICLDAGHDASTRGKRSFDQTFLEYQFNWQIAQLVEAYLSQWGITCFNNRCSVEEVVSLKERVKRAEAGKADIFVSIHANAFGEEWNEVTGWEIYCAANESSLRLARCIHQSSLPYLGLKDRGIKQADWVVLRQNIPAVLIEHGFYTNKTEKDRLLCHDFQIKCAWADAKGILKYFFD